MTPKRLFKTRWWWSKSDNLVIMWHRGQCVFIWRKDPKWWADYPVWKVCLPYGIVIEKWSRPNV